MAVTRNDAGLNSLRTCAVVAKVLICGYLLMLALLSLTASFFLYQELTEQYSVFPVTLPGFAFYLLLAFAVSAVPVVLWIRRAHINLQIEKLDGLNYSPGWATGSFFVPGANLFIPFRAMRELWNRSHGEPDHFAHQSVEMVSSWWTCLIVGSMIQLFLAALVTLERMTFFRVLSPPGINTFFLLFSMLLLAGSAIMLFRIIGAITRAQHSVTHVGDTFA